MEDAFIDFFGKKWGNNLLEEFLKLEALFSSLYDEGENGDNKDADENDDGRNVDAFKYDFSQAQGSSKLVLAIDHRLLSSSFRTKPPFILILLGSCGDQFV